MMRSSPFIAACASMSDARMPRSRSRAVSMTGAAPMGRCLLLAEGEPAKALVEAGDVAAAVEHACAAARPGRMDLGVDVELQGVAFLAPGGAGLEGGAVGHLHLDHVIIGMGVALHRQVPDFRLVPTSLESIAPK